MLPVGCDTMPNGGVKRCANCYFNDPVTKYGPADGAGPFKAEAWAVIPRESFCEIRGAQIPAPYSTTCRNFWPTPFPKGHPRIEEPDGPIMIDGLEDAYGVSKPIPWHGSIAPSIGVPATCSRCGKHVEKGILVKLAGKESLPQFCSNRHYAIWWCSMHGEQHVSPGDY